ncbi:hypothetical protein VPH35_033789 [Triticum aestivum]|uniref:Uncharacterized protein n=1 Tax=Aegilops tauschii subsp. strangulata TaxID=200361 RepID=A0A453A9Q7_AEGTS
MIRFAHVRHRDIAFDAGVVSCRGVALSLSAWSPSAHGHRRVWRYYYRIAVENMPVQSWNKEAVQDALGKTCHVDRLERQTTSLSNTACLFAWVWAWSPDDIPTKRGSPSSIAPWTPGAARRCRRAAPGTRG